MEDANGKQIEERLDFVDFTGEQRKVLAGMLPLIKDTLGGALDKFYAKAKVNAETSRFFASENHIAQAKGMQARPQGRSPQGRRLEDRIAPGTSGR